MISFDHVIYAVDNFDVATERFLNLHGLASVPGGRHPGHGTGNRIVPLGSSYLELMGIVDDEEAQSSPLGWWLNQRLDSGGGLSALCLATDDIDAVANRLGLDTLSMSRVNEDGGTLHWRLVGLETALTDPPLPFFIQWDIPDELHPGRLRAPHKKTPQGISWIELRSDEERLTSWIGQHDLDIRVAPGDPGITAVGVATEEGTLILR